jgi:hypothetical protein
MILLPLFASIAFGFTPLQQPKSLYQQVMLAPDPNNGYGEYLRAADLTRDSVSDLYLTWTPSQYQDLAKQKGSPDSENPSRKWDALDERRLSIARSLSELDYLGVQRLASQRYGQVVSLIRAGNEKRVWDPREKLDSATMFPELSQFKTVCRILAADAYVRFADGDSKGGSADLLEALTMSRRIRGAAIINELVGIALQAIVLRVFDEHLANLSEADANQIARYCEDAIAEPNTYSQSLMRERDMQLSAVDDLFGAPGKELADALGGGEEVAPIANYMKNMSPSERRSARDHFRKTVNQFYDQAIGIFSENESKWLTKPNPLPAEPATITTPEDLADALVSMFMPIFEQATTAVMRSRAQLRLLDLHARIIAYRWHFDRLPAELKDAIPAELRNDPMSNEAFVYERQGETTYSLYSKGTAATGKIELLYRRPPNLQQNDDPIPPRGALR